MGQTLSCPDTVKHTESGGNERFFYGLAEMQGWRVTMEDAHAAVLDLDGPDDNPNTFFAVYDGHGGSTVAKFAGQNVHRRLVTEESYKDKDYQLALKRAFLGTDEDLLANPAHTRDPSGCTAVAALITSDNKIYVANAGDSRTVLGIKGEVKPLSFDHKPTSEIERARISGAGGYIEYGRVNGNLALSRALGDFEFKKNYSITPEAQIITANPDVTMHQISDDDEFLVLACDGIWDCLSSQQVIDFVRYQVSEGKDLIDIGKMMCDHCLAPDTTSGAGIGCDNMTVLIVAITHGRSKEEWYQWVTERVKSGYGYNTPGTVPQLYSHSRLVSFRARQEAQEARERMNERERNGGRDSPSGVGAAFGTEDFLRRYGLTVSTMSGGGISYRPGGNVVNDNGRLMFGNDESDDEVDSDDEGTSSTSVFGHTLGLGGASRLGGAGEGFISVEDDEDDLDDDDDDVVVHEPSDPATKDLKAQLENYEKDGQGATDAQADEGGDKDNSVTKLPNGDVAAHTPDSTTATNSISPEPSSAEPLKPGPEPVVA